MLACAALFHVDVPAQTQGSAPTERDVLAHYGAVVHAAYADTLAVARDMQRTIHAFLAAPSEAGLNQARQAWVAARDRYGQTEAFRFYGGPIDEPEGRINAWPMDEAYIDAVQGRPDAGMINDPKRPITRASLIALNEKDGEENISTGWHAIEFMLWGQDLSETGPGARAWTEFVDGRAPHAARRRLYLRTVTDLLVDDLSALEKAWSPGDANNFRAGFERDPQSLARVFTGIGVLSRGELAGERLEVALDTQAQEDEHSCFSDTTQRDVVANALGIRNVWRGEYTRRDGSTVKGPGLNALVAARDAPLATRLDREMDVSVATAQSIPAPFDRAIVADSLGRPAVEATVAALKQQAQSLVRAAATVGVRQLNTAIPQ